MSLTEGRLTESGGMRGLQAATNRVTEDHVAFVPAGTLIDDFESGSDGAAFTATGNWVSVVGSPTYESDAAIHGSRGLRLDASGELARYTIPNGDCSGSFYFTCRAVASSANRFFAIQSTIGGTYVQLRQHSNFTFNISNRANTQIGAATTLTWTVGDVFRVDWEATISGTSPAVAVNLECRFFKNANKEGTTADEALSRGVTAETEIPGRVMFLSSAAGYVTDIDTVRHSDVLEWLGPYS